MEGKSKVIILLTDGINNAGRIEPLTAAAAAQTLGIKVYTIGTGTKGLAPYPATDLFGRTVYQNVPVEIDEEMLKKVSAMTNGQYFRATDTQSLRDIYGEINKLEKVKFEEQGYRQYAEHFGTVLIAALLLFLIEILLSGTVFLKIP